MKNLTLHKYFTVNLYIYVNIICILDFIMMLFMLIVSADSVFRLSNPIFTMGIISFFVIPLSISLIILEFILRQFKIIKKNCNEYFSQIQIKFVYVAASGLLILYLINLCKDISYSLSSNI